MIKELQASVVAARPWVGQVPIYLYEWEIHMLAAKSAWYKELSYSIHKSSKQHTLQVIINSNSRQYNCDPAIQMLIIEALCMHPFTKKKKGYLLFRNDKVTNLADCFDLSPVDFFRKMVPNPLQCHIASSICKCNKNIFQSCFSLL